MSRALAETGRLDFFFANAGVTQLGRTPPEQLGNKAGAVKEVQQAVRTIATIPGDEFSEVMRINALSVFLAIKYAAPALSVTSAAKPVPGGSIVVTASVAGIRSNAGPIAYSASKAAVISMAQTSAYELAGKNIRVNAICPGLIETNMTKALFTLARGSGKGDAVGQLNPLHRYGLPYGAFWELAAQLTRQRSPRPHSSSCPTSRRTSTARPLPSTVVFPAAIPTPGSRCPAARSCTFCECRRNQACLGPGRAAVHAETPSLYKSVSSGSATTAGFNTFPSYFVLRCSGLCDTSWSTCTKQRSTFGNASIWSWRSWAMSCAFHRGISGS